MTKTDIANIALAKFREGRITNIESTTDPVAVVMNDQYNHALELVLEEHRWNFAGKRVTLTQLSNDPPFGWDHQYALPSDIIRLKDVNGEDVEASSRLFELEGNALLTNDDTVTITYVARITDTNLFSPSFVEALSFKLASITCGRLTGDTELAIALDKQYNYALSKAVHNDTKAAGSRDRNLMQRMLDSSPLLGGRYRYPSSGSSSGGSTSGTVSAHKHELTDLLQTGATDGQHIVWNDTDGVWEAADITGGSPLTTKGDIYTYGTAEDKLPVGTDGQFLKADSTEATGLKWVTASGTGDLLAANNLSELTPTAATARTNLGLGTAATNNTGDFAAASHTHSTADVTSGTFANARISEANVTQHQAALSVTASQVSDFDTEVSNNTSVAANTAKVTNATHTGDVTGSTALTVDKTAISGKTLVTAAAGDHILVGDASDTDNLKKVTAQSIADLAAGGASQLSDLSDVVSATNTDKFVLVANGTTGYVGRALLEADISDLQAYITGITGEPLSDLSDVTITSIASGEILRWNGSAWINQTHAEAGLPTVDIQAGAPASTPTTEGDIYIDTTNDVAYVATGTASSGDWTNVSSGGGASQLSDLSDVNTSTPTNRNVLVADGVDFESRALVEADISDLGSYITASSADTLTNKTFDANGTGNSISNIDPADLSATGTPSASTYLRGDNTWASIAGGGDVNKVGTPVDNQVGVWTGDGTIEGTTGLTYDGSVLGVTGNITVTGTVDGVDIAGRDHNEVTIAESGGRNYVTLSAGTQQLTLNTVDLTADVSGLLPSGNIADDAVTYAKIQNVVANNVILGNNVGAGGVVDELTAAEVRTIINVEDGADVTDSTNVVSALNSAVLTDAGTPAATDQVLIKDAGTGALQTADFSDFGGGGGNVATDTIWDAAGDLAIGTGADTAARLAIGTNGQVLTSNGTTAAWAAEVTELGIAVSDETTALTTGTAKGTFRMPYAMTVTDVRATVTTAPTGANIIVDIKDGGASIMTTNLLSIDATEKTSTTAATAPNITDTALADDAEITIDIVQIGSTIAGAGLKIWIIGTRA